MKTDFATPTEDPKSKDEYYVDLPAIKAPVMARRPESMTFPEAYIFLLFENRWVLLRQVLDKNSGRRS
jgi:hypothetical protein